MGKIPWTEEPGGLQSMGSQRVGHDWTSEHGKHNMIRALFATQKNRCFHWNFKMIYFVENVRFCRSEVVWKEHWPRIMELIYSRAFFHSVCDFEKLLHLLLSHPWCCHTLCASGAFCCLCAVKSFVLLLILGSSTDVDILYCYSAEKYQRILIYDV